MECDSCSSRSDLYIKCVYGHIICNKCIGVKIDFVTCDIEYYICPFPCNDIIYKNHTKSII